MKTRFKFSHQAGGFYYWVATTPVGPNESRYEHVICPVDWFWGRR